MARQVLSFRVAVKVCSYLPQVVSTRLSKVRCLHASNSMRTNTEFRASHMAVFTFDKPVCKTDMMNYHTHFLHLRYKHSSKTRHKKAYMKYGEYKHDNDTNEEEQDGSKDDKTNWTLKKAHNVRAETLLGHGFGFSHSVMIEKIEEGRVLHQGQVFMDKGYTVNEGDVFDLILRDGAPRMVKRMEVIQVKEKLSRSDVTLKVSKRPFEEDM